MSHTVGQLWSKLDLQCTEATPYMQFWAPDRRLLPACAQITTQAIGQFCMNSKRPIFAELDAQVEAVTAEWYRVALAVWQRLREEDPELSGLALELFGAEEKAAHWFARSHGDVTCYGRLAAGDREWIRQHLLAAQYGIYM